MAYLRFDTKRLFAIIGVGPKGDALIEMKIYIRGEYHRDPDDVEKDKRFLKKLFGLTHSFGSETVYLTDWKEHRATATLDTDDYEIKRK